MALQLVSRALLAPGDVVAVEHPGYVGAWESFRSCGARLVPIAVDEGGLRVDDLARLIERTPVRAVFVTPHHQFPTTVTLAGSRRTQLLRLAERHRFAIIEDDYDHEFHYDGRPIVPLASVDTSGVVLYVGSLSKIFAPGLRTGYLVAPKPLLQRLREIRATIDLQGDLANDWALATLFQDGEVQRHWRKARRVYRARRDVLCEAVKSELDDALRFQVPTGGMALWADVEPAIDVEAWAARALDQGMSFRTGALFYEDGRSRQKIRLGFARLNKRELLNAVRRLVRAQPARAPGRSTSQGSPKRVRR